MTANEFKKYIEETRGRMLRFATTILRNRNDAEEVTSQVCEKLWREHERLRADTSASAFAMTSVRNGCYDHVRYRNRRQHEEPHENLTSSEETFENRDTIELVRFAMGQLPSPQREILHLKDIEGYSTHEIAEIYNKEEANIRMILSRGRTALREIIIKTMQR